MVLDSFIAQTVPIQKQAILIYDIKSLSPQHTPTLIILSHSGNLPGENDQSAVLTNLALSLADGVRGPSFQIHQ